MPSLSGRTTRVVLLCATFGLGAVAAPAQAARTNPFLGDHSGELRNLDARPGRIAATDAQRARAAQLGAAVRFNDFGTPRSLARPDGSALATGLSGDPVVAARQFLKANQELFKLGPAAVDALQVIGRTKLGTGHAVLLRQAFGSLIAARDGLIAIAVRNGEVIYASSSGTPHTDAPPSSTLTGSQAWAKAAQSVGLTAGAVSGVQAVNGFTTFRSAGLAGAQYVRAVAIPTPAGTRAGFEAIVQHTSARGGPKAFTVLLDGRTGDVLMRESNVDHLARNPRWKVFPSQPRTQLVAPFPDEPPTGETQASPYRYDDTDIRQLWCWSRTAGCQRTLFNENTGRESIEWDEAGLLFAPSGTSRGNNADSQEAWFSPLTGGIANPTPRRAPTPPDPNREYQFTWTNQWNRAQCSPSVFGTPQQNDVLAATANLFAMHNRMHNWSYTLGFTEERWNLQENNYRFQSPDGPVTRELDPEHGGVQAGAVTGGPPTYAGRDNANQITLNDGIPGITNMYLWQPIAGAFYAPCTDGDYDMSIIGHEYTHAISNRMVAGPDGSLSSDHGGAMGESWSDLTAVEYLNEYGLAGQTGEDPFSVASYVTDDRKRGIRNYNMSRNPLNLSNYGYDVLGPEVHSDGEIWDAVNFDIRRDLIAKYNRSYPASNLTLQADCANGRRPADTCPGNRRWIQLVFDAYLLMNSDVDMVDARTAYLTADEARFGGANRALIWEAFARRGFGASEVPGRSAQVSPSEDDDEESGASRGVYDTDPVANFESPVHNREALVRFVPTSADGGAAPAGWEVFVGHYEARSTPVADGTVHPHRNYDPPTSARFVPGTYEFVVRAPGFGHVRLTRAFGPGQRVALTIPMPRNLASAASGATATGPGDDPGDAIDDTEDSSYVGGEPGAASQLTVDLAGTAPATIRRVRVSALPRLEFDDIGDPIGRRFSALRQFEVLACVKTATRPCAADADFEEVFTSSPDAFPGERPRPRAPDLIIRSFDIPDTAATHLRIRPVTNQCTGFAGFHGEQDADPLDFTDCRFGSGEGEETVITEFQAIRTATAF